MPFVLIIPQEIVFPDERQSIMIKYSQFSLWIKSNGKKYQDWYKQ